MKRIVDVAATVVGLLLLWPLFVLLVALVRIMLGSPVFFCQQRPGLRGRPFVMYKFRTMNDDHDAAGNLLPDASPLTAVNALPKLAPNGF